MLTMYKKLTLLFFMLMPVCMSAQEVVEATMTEVVEAQTVPQARFGYLSYSTVIRVMPEYKAAQEKLDKLQKQYETELERADREFNRKFAEFIEGQKEFPANIMIKRQKELQDLMEKSIAFKQEMKALIEKARQELEAPITEKLNAAIARIGNQHQLDYVLNTDNNACPYINEKAGVDITHLVKIQLGIQ